MLWTISGVSIIVKLHHQDFNKALGEQASWELHKNTDAILNTSSKQKTTKHHLEGHLLPISQTDRVR